MQFCSYTKLYPVKSRTFLAIYSGLQLDIDGNETIQFLKNTRRIIYRISGTHPSSLGLHPVVYFYSANGRYQPTSFLAVIGLIKEFEKRDNFRTFTKYREGFENFILSHKEFAN